jgi:hypothetical protein
VAKGIVTERNSLLYELIAAGSRASISRDGLFEMRLRAYQQDAVQRTLESWDRFDRVLGVAAVGAGKTIIASTVIQARLPEGPALFIAFRDELLFQALDKMRHTTGIVVREQSGSQASLSDRVVVADAARSQAPEVAGRTEPRLDCGAQRRTSLDRKEILARFRRSFTAPASAVRQH